MNTHTLSGITPEILEKYKEYSREGLIALIEELRAKLEELRK